MLVYSYGRVVEVEEKNARVSFGGNSGMGTQDAGPAGTQVLTYDGSGSLTSGFSQSYEYDDAGRLKNVRKAGALVESYIYDHEGRRFKKTSGGETTYYIGKDYQTVVNSSGTFNTIYYYANNELIGRKAGPVFLIVCLPNCFCMLK